MAICGPKLSLAGCIISAWGIVQLSLMGIFFWIHSVALVEDLNIDEEKISSKGEYVNAMEASYNQNAMNCWIAALLYLVTLCVSAQQFWMNNRSTYSV
jgi:ribonuclease kappa